MGNQITRLDDVLTKATESTEAKEVGRFSERFPDAWRTILRVTGLYESDQVNKEAKMKITSLNVIGDDADHTIFGLGNDNAPYVWQDGRWIPHV